MKILVTLLLLTSIVIAVRPPAPLCKTVTIPELLPVTIGEEMRFDLQDVFSGYNLYINSTAKSHITVTPKYEYKEFSYPSTYNLTVAKIKPWGRFWGLVINGAYSKLVGGTSRNKEGVTFEVEVQLQNRDNLHCFDVDQIFTQDGSLVVIDCASFFQGQVLFNQFLYYNTTSKKVIESTHLHDTFVNYNYLSKRRIQIIEDPFTRIPYLFRFHLRDGVSPSHKDQTYMEIFMLDNPSRPQLLDVVDHTFFQMRKLSIADYQVHNNLIYLLIYNEGVYQMTFTPDQHLVKRASFDMALDITKFRVDQLGFNDDLNLVMSNENTIYQFEWDVSTAPVLVTKYTLIPKSEVQQVFVDYNFVIAVTDSVIDGEVTRRTWVFTKRTNSYLNAYNVFHAPTLHSPHIIVWDQHGSTLHIFHDQNLIFVDMSLPYLHIAPVNESMINQTQNYEVLATSVGDKGDSTQCSIQFKFLYLSQDDKRIIKTGYWPRRNIYVDSPDKREIPLSFEFFGANLTYNISFDINSSIFPHAYVNKEHQAVFNWPEDIDPASIVYYEMFTEERTREEKPTAIYGLVQTANITADKTVYNTFYVKCTINVFDRDEKHNMNCQNVYKTVFSMGRIIRTSQMYDAEERRIAIIFDSAPHTVYIYYFWPSGFGSYGRKDYAGDAGNKVTGVAISQGKLFVVLEYGKRVDMFKLEDLRGASDQPRNPAPRMSLTSQLMRFFGVKYFAPVSLKVSRFHKEAIFLKTKTGIMVFNVNEDFLPELLFTVDTVNIMYDFEVNHDHLLVLTEQSSILYDLDAPLRRQALPYKRQTIKQHFKLGEYDEVCSDRLFYIVGNQSAHIINPGYRSVSAYYSQVWAGSQIISVDAVNIKDREIFFLRTKTQILAYVFAENPTMTLEWTANSPDFKLSLSAYNPTAQSQPYTLGFQVLNNNQTQIIPTEYFNADEVAKLGHLKSPKNVATYQGTVQINDTHWFDGNVLNYSFQCNTTECQETTTIQNHVEFTRQVVQGRAIYDIESSGDGIYAQQYASVFKTYTHNDSIHFINMIPVTRSGEVCTKMATGDNEEYLVSLCQLGDEVNLYVTTLIANKPFTFGPYQTDAKAVNHARIEGSILMIVDNEDNPFVRSGGILLYHLNFDFDENEFITLLDYIDHEDLQIEGYQGTPYIGSADLHMPFFNLDHEYRLFLTETRTGAIFVFGFQVSADGEEIVYLSKKYIPLEQILPHEIKYPTPLRVQNIAIHFAFDDQNKTVEYYLLLSVTNWHHMELMITLSHQDQILGAKVERLFERFPWQLQNYFKWKRGFGYPTYFAVPYIDYEESKQLIMVYEVPYILRRDADNYQDKYSPHNYELYGGLVPILRSFGAHSVGDVYETAFDFHTFGTDKLLWSDMSGTDISEFTLNKNITLTIKGRTTPNDTILVTAYNPYTNFTFSIDINFNKDKDDDDEAREILWIGIVVIGVFMIIGILIAFCRQSKHQPHHHLPADLKETLLTQEQQRNQDNINRTSVDPGSIRGSIEPSLTPIVAPPKAQRQAEPKAQIQPQESEQMVRERESSSSSGDEVPDLTH